MAGVSKSSGKYSPGHHSSCRMHQYDFDCPYSCHGAYTNDRDVESAWWNGLIYPKNIYA